MFSFLGWLNVVLLGIIIAPYILVFINKKFIKTKHSSFRALLKFLKKLHKPLGLLLLILALVHGYLALGRIALHTGSVLFVTIFIAASLGGSFYKLKKRPLFTWHKRMAFIVIVFLLLHIFYPNALWYLLN